TYWEVMLPDHGRLLTNAVRWALNEPTPVEVTGPGLVDATLYRQRDALVLHLVNFTNPMMMKGPMHELTPVGAQRVRIRVGAGDRPGRARLLVAGKDAPIRAADGSVELTVPSVLDHEVVAVDLR